MTLSSYQDPTADRDRAIANAIVVMLGDERSARFPHHYDLGGGWGSV